MSCIEVVLVNLDVSRRGVRSPAWIGQRSVRSLLKKNAASTVGEHDPNHAKEATIPPGLLARGRTEWFVPVVHLL